MGNYDRGAGRTGLEKIKNKEDDDDEEEEGAVKIFLCVYTDLV